MWTDQDEDCVFREAGGLQRYLRTWQRCPEELKKKKQTLLNVCDNPSNGVGVSGTRKTWA